LDYIRTLKKMTEPIIEVSGLAKNFGSLQAVRDLSFRVNYGEVYGFLGQNGAGKSTTIRMLLTLIRPSSGDIRILGMDLRQQRAAILRQTGAIIERPDFYKYLSAAENLQMLAAISGVKIGRKEIDYQLERVGLKARAGSKVKTYSQGMKQRLGIAAALLHNPRLVVLDEPTNGLDPQGIADMRQMIIRLSKEEGKTVLVSSHLLSEVEMIADSMIIIDKGRKVAEGPVRELLNPEKIKLELTTEDNDQALTVLTNSGWMQYYLRAQNGSLFFSLPKKEIPLMNRFLVERNVNITGLHARQSLEDYFLSLTS